ncbi:metalloenzyme domain-containing protein, partial [Myxococcota bacterium]|nr:metalloenzyme domain-containing protein [Myxococcota bacterium]
MIDVNTLVGSHDVLFLTLDTLRFDVARDLLAQGRTPNLARLVGVWEERHSPATFTYAA